MGEPLFRKVANRTVIAEDLFDKKHTRPLKNFRFRVSAFGILRKDNKILVQRHPLLTKYGLPGGGIDIGKKLSKGFYKRFQENSELLARR